MLNGKMNVNKNNLKKGAPNRNHPTHQFIYDKRYTYVNMFAFYMFWNCRFSRVCVGIWERTNRAVENEWINGRMCECVNVYMLFNALFTFGQIYTGIQFNIVTKPMWSGVFTSLSNGTETIDMFIVKQKETFFYQVNE